MKKLFLFATAVMIFAACSKDATEDVAILPDNVLHVSVGDDDSRIQLDENCRTVWNEGDLVSVFNKTTGNECWRFDGKTGDTVGTLSKVSGNAGTTTDKVVAVYPYDTECTVSGNMITTAIPATQTYRADSFGDGGNMMVAISDNNDLKFKNIFGWIRLSLTDDLERSVEHIEFSGNNDEKLAGDVIIDANTQNLYMAGNNASSITFGCGTGVKLSKTVPTYFYIAVVPQTFTKGVSVNIRMTNGTSLEKHYEDSFTVIRNHIQPVKAGNFQSASDSIFYTTADGQPVDMRTIDGFGANFVANTYENGQGAIRFDGNITTIPANAFSGCTSLTSINVPDSVTSIGEGAFNGCTSLTGVYITDIAKWCEVYFKYLNDNPLHYAHNLYLNGELITDLVIPEGVTSIGHYTFQDCSSIISVNVPDGVTSIEYGAFRGCCNLTSINIPDGVISIGNGAFYGCGNLTGITIPNSVTSIKPAAFYGCSSLTSITIPNSVTLIETNVFYGCSNLTSITIPDGIISIGGSAFSGCTSLTSVTIPDSVTSIGGYAFSGCTALKSVTIPDSITTIGKRAFESCHSLMSIDIPNGVTSIEDYTFYGCANLTNVTISNSVTSIGQSAFRHCSNLTSITIPDSVTSIGMSAFNSCDSLESIDIPDSVTSLGDNSFSYCGRLKSVIIGNGITAIGIRTFHNCSRLTSITIPDGIKSIGTKAFYDCTSLTSIYCKPTTPPTLGSDALYNISSSVKIYVPMVSVDAYKSATNWSSFADKIAGYDFN